MGAIEESMCPTFVTPGDALPAGRRKVIHSVGVVGKVEWRDAGGHPYTGIFKEKLYHRGPKLKVTFGFQCNSKV